jgi:FMN reductase
MLVVGIGGTTRPESSSETALALTLRALRQRGCETHQFSGAALRLDPYESGVELQSEAVELLEHCRVADAVVISSPGYHGSISGMLKNVLDYLEELREDPRPYLDGRPVGCVAVAHGWQASVNTLRTLRDIVHSLRGTPTPLGVSINSAGGSFARGTCTDAAILERLDLLAGQVHELATGMATVRTPSLSVAPVAL